MRVRVDDIDRTRENKFLPRLAHGACDHCQYPDLDLTLSDVPFYVISPAYLCELCHNVVVGGMGGDRLLCYIGNQILSKLDKGKASRRHKTTIPPTFVAMYMSNEGPKLYRPAGKVTVCRAESQLDIMASLDERCSLYRVMDDHKTLHRLAAPKSGMVPPPQWELSQSDQDDLRAAINGLEEEG